MNFVPCVPRASKLGPERVGHCSASGGKVMYRPSTCSNSMLLTEMAPFFYATQLQKHRSKVVRSILFFDYSKRSFDISLTKGGSSEYQVLFAAIHAHPPHDGTR